MRFFLLIHLLLFTLLSFGQINQKGLPIITNFSPELYDGSDQNWSAVQDNRGVMYFGNNDLGVLEYDGKTWRKIPVPRNASVRSLAVDSIGTVYVGTVGDFGYLAPNALGTLEYISLLDAITDSVGHFSDILKIHVVNNKVFFFNRTYLFIYDGGKVDVIDINPERKYANLYSFYENNRYYIGSFILGLRELAGDSVVIAKNGEFFQRMNIIGMIPMSDSTLAIVSTTQTTQNLYSYNQYSGEVKLLENSDKFYSKIFGDGGPYNAIGLNDSTIGIANIFSENFSFSQVDFDGNPVRVVNKASGLLDETAIDLFQSKDGSGSNPLWIPLNLGISRLDIHSPIGRFSEESGIRGGIMQVEQFNNRLIVLTMSGVFYQDFDKNGLAYFRQINEINSSSWSHLIFKDPQTGKERLLIGTVGNGIYEVDNKFLAKNISSSAEFKGIIEHIAYSLHQSKSNPNIVYIGMSGSFAAMEWKDGIWKNLGRVAEDKLIREYRGITSVKPNELWLVTYINGISRVIFGKDTIVEDYGLDHGLKSLKDITFTVVDNQVYFATNSGIVKFNEEAKMFEPAILPGLSNTIEDRGVSRFVTYDDGYVLSCSQSEASVRWLEMVRPGDNGNDIFEKKPFRSLPARVYDYLYVDDNETLWIVISTDLFSFDKSVNRSYNDPFNALIRKVIITGDSLVFNGAFSKDLGNGKNVVSNSQEVSEVPSFSYRYNNITFDVSSSFYEREDLTEYSFMLVGNDKDWSKWNNTPNPIYTNLSEGSYTFRVKARNVFGVESTTAEYSFSISPPWYRSIVAIIFYVILLGLIVWSIVAYNTRRLIAEKIRLEQIVKERTAEVVAQKEELEKQRDKIFEQNEEIKSSINYASRIQNALLTPKETIDEIFKDYFILFLPRDIVSGDFYWHTQIGSRKICAISDCTGHGVPGGFMSMLGIAFLTQIMAKGEKLTASQILDQLRAMIIASLHQTGKMGESKDGMDIALYIIDTETGMLEFAGANNPLVIIRDNEIIQVKGDKMPIGIHIKYDTPFTNNVMEYHKGDVIYTFSDGYPDQFGGPNERKFMIKNLKEMFLEIHKKPMSEQKEILYNTLLNWQGDSSRIDDVVVMGLRL